MTKRPLFLLLLTATLVPGVPQLVRAEAPSEESVNRAVKSAVKALKAYQEANGAWIFDADQSEKNVGATALAGLALLEGGCPPNDPAVSKAAARVRALAPQLTETYSISLAIYFLDRFGGANESGTIKDLATKLKTGMVDGGWSYKCGGMAAAAQQDPMRLAVFGPQEQEGPVADNSNTQFAILALWVARKHKVSVEDALKAADARFRKTQRKDGSWGYGTMDAPMDRSMPTMTCAGLLGIALGYGSAKDKSAYLKGPSKGASDIADDQAVAAALIFLENKVGNAPSDHPQWVYYLWSLGRIGMAYKVNTIGSTDWYAWGAERLLASQFEDGSWKTKYGPAIDTSFAVLFLKRSDLVGDIRSGGTPTAAAPPSAKSEENETPRKKPREERPPPPAPEKDDSPRLAIKLVRAADSRREALIAEYRESRGVDYTLALAAAIPDLQGEMRDKARAALTIRMERMSVRTLRQYLGDEDREIRRAAAQASQAKKARELVPDLIRLLRDPSEGVVDAAHSSLKRITDQAFDRRHETWEAWWKANKDS